jgi:3-deoxy-D-manno-octulosonic-acid transferase
VFYVPLDFAFAVRAYLRALRPAAVVLMESELWPRMLHECDLAGVAVVVVNARVSDRSFRRAMRMRPMWGGVLRMPALWLAQSEEDARRLVAMGAEAEAVRVGGNLKYDVRAPQRSRVAELIKEVAGGRRVLVGGSTIEGDPPEDSPLIRTQQSMEPEQRPLLVLAPRHPENFGITYSMAMEFPSLSATELLVGKRTVEGGSVALSTRKRETHQVEIVVLDTIGDLAAVYGVADVAFVGGSLIKRGGHNPLEPAQFGVPVIMGPSYENFRDVVGKMLAANAICIVKDSEQLGSVIVGMLTDHEAAKAMGERGRRVFEEQQGATGRAVEAIVGVIRKVQR